MSFFWCPEFSDGVQIFAKYLHPQTKDHEGVQMPTRISEAKNYSKMEEPAY
jgi:hypothetical protein